MIEKKIILGSKSPRRRYLLAQADIPFDVMKFDFEEVFPEKLPVSEVAEYLAVQKARHAQTQISKEDLLITADTVVIYKDILFGKPKDMQDAFRILSTISGQKHEVITGVCLMSKEKCTSFSVSSFVYINEMSHQEIEYYINHYDVLDKAGSYGIQDWLGWCKIKKIEGSYSNIMGLPMAELYDAIQQF